MKHIQRKQLMHQNKPEEREEKKVRLQTLAADYNRTPLENTKPNTPHQRPAQLGDYSPKWLRCRFSKTSHFAPKTDRNPRDHMPPPQGCECFPEMLWLPLFPTRALPASALPCATPPNPVVQVILPTAECLPIPSSAGFASWSGTQQNHWSCNSLPVRRLLTSSPTSPRIQAVTLVSNHYSGRQGFRAEWQGGEPSKSYHYILRGP